MYISTVYNNTPTNVETASLFINRPPVALAQHSNSAVPFPFGHPELHIAFICIYELVCLVLCKNRKDHAPQGDGRYSYLDTGSYEGGRVQYDGKPADWGMGQVHLSVVVVDGCCSQEVQGGAHTGRTDVAG